MVWAHEVDEIPVYVHNGFLIKHIMDDPEVKDGLVLIGTFIQMAFSGQTDPQSGSESDDLDTAASERIPKTVLSSAESVATVQRIFRKREKTPNMRFAYRFNDQTADERSGAVDWRRTERHKTSDMGECIRHTFQIKAPLELEVIFNAFPFKVVSASLMIELSTYTTEDERTRLRPNLILHRNEKRNMCGIQPAYKKQTYKSTNWLCDPSWFCKAENKSLKAKAREKIDRSYVYDFATPFPDVTYYYDQKKKYCPKYSVCFMMVEDGMKKFVEIVFPMLLIAAMNHLNVANAVWADKGWSDETVAAVDYINNSATLALAVVVFLPTMFGRARFHEIFNANNMYVTTIFVALTLSATPHAIAESVWPARIGAYLFWGSFLFPIINGIRFKFFLRAQRQNPRPEFFMEDNKLPECQRFKPGNSSVFEHFIAVSDLVELAVKDPGQLVQMQYTVGKSAKFGIVEYGNDGGAIPGETYNLNSI